MCGEVIPRKPYYQYGRAGRRNARRERVGEGSNPFSSPLPNRGPKYATETCGGDAVIVEY